MDSFIEQENDEYFNETKNLITFQIFNISSFSFRYR